MIGGSTFASIFGNMAAGDVERIVETARSAAQAGCAVVINKPGRKEPLCILTARQAKTEDRKAQETARAIGDLRAGKRKHACGLKHAMTKPEQVVRVVRRLLQEVGQV